MLSSRIFFPCIVSQQGGDTTSGNFKSQTWQVRNFLNVLIWSERPGDHGGDVATTHWQLLAYCLFGTCPHSQEGLSGNLSCRKGIGHTVTGGEDCS